MADPKNPTPKTSISNSVRNSVHNILQQNKDQVMQNSSDFRSASDKTARDSKAIAAASAMYRATKDATFKPADNLVKDYYAAAAHIAELRGIKPDNSGNFSDEQYKNELSPENILKAYAGSMAHSHGEQAFETLVKPAIQSAYTDSENNEDTAKEIPQELLNLGNITLKTDSDFFSLNEEEQKNYLASVGDFERDRLTKELEKNSKSKSSEKDDKTKNAGEFNFMDDPDWGRKEDEEIKIEQGDIIDYLMKEVILKGASWTLDKFVAAPAGVILYESLHGVHYGVTKPAWEKASQFLGGVKDATVRGAKAGWNGVFKNKDKEQTAEEKEVENKRKEGFLLLSGEYEKRIKEINDHISAFDGEDWKTLSLIEKELANHRNILADTGILIYEKDGVSKTIPYKDPYNKENLTKRQEDLDAEQIETINARLNPQNDPETQKKIEDQYKKAVETIHQSVRDREERTITDGEVNGFADAFKYAQTKSTHKIEHRPEIEKTFALQGLFAAHYNQFMLSQEIIKNPSILDDPKSIREFSEKNYEEAAKIFAGVYTGKNNPKNISCEALVAEAASLVEKSKNGKPVENTIEATYSPKQNRGPVAFADAFNNMTLEEMYTKQLINLERRETELTAQQQTTDNVRNRINQIKQQIKTPNNEELKKFKVGDIRTKNTERAN